MTARIQPIDLGELETWLRGQPRSVSAAIAVRCSLRALPLLFWELEGEDDRLFNVLKTFRQNNAAFAFVCSEEDFNQTFGLTSDFRSSETDNPAVQSAYYAADAAFAEVRSGQSSIDPRFGDSIASASLEIAIRATLQAIYIDSEIAGAAYENDVRQLREGASPVRLAQTELWQGSSVPSAIAEAWENLKRHLSERKQNWETWTDWYDDRGAGLPPVDITLEMARVTLPEPMWEEGADAINPELLHLLELFEKGGSEQVVVRFNELRWQAEKAQLSGQKTTTSPQTSAGSAEESIPNVWLLQYNDGDRVSNWTQTATPGSTLRWKTGKSLPRNFSLGDQVVYWRTTQKGGVVGTGHVSSLTIETENGIQRIPTEVHEFFEDDLIPRAEAIKAAGIDRKVFRGAILDLPIEQAFRLDALLREKDRSPIFSDDQRNIIERDLAGGANTNVGIGAEEGTGAAGSGTGSQGVDGTGSGDASPGTETDFNPDDAETERDDLGRGVLAIALGRRLHRIWCELNGALPKETKNSGQSDEQPLYEATYWTGVEETDAPSGEQHNYFFDRGRSNTRAGFVLHLDAPWGGGKTTFANFLSRVLNPCGYTHGKNSFLSKRYAGKIPPAVFLQASEGTGDGRDWPDAARRPWIVVPFNAWQAQHVKPPWWVFYQTIRKRCFDSVIYEGWAPEELNKEAAAKPGWLKRQYLRMCLWVPEISWRIGNPKVTTLFLTALVSVALLAGLASAGIIDVFGQGDEAKVGLVVGDGIGFLLGGLTGVSFLWGLGALFTESIRPGTDTLAERLSLGSGDPFERFRRHFYKTMKRVKRPVLVVIDDLDRCSPEFIVDLVRGIQTLLRSPRVAFVVLGDRDWIERAFEVYHKDMSKVSVGPEQSFGARFVEKAIQMSFILPGLPEEKQKEYVRFQLLGEKAEEATETKDKVAPETVERVRAIVQDSLKVTAPTKRDSVTITADLRRIADQLGKSEDRLDLQDALKSETITASLVREELAIHSATDDVAASHRLEPLAEHLPSNPRQIKRIINAVSMYNAVAHHQRSKWESDNARWLQLARWIIIMTEWPKTWRLLACYPAISDLVHANDPAAACTKMLKDAKRAAELPESKETALEEVERIKSDATLLALMAGDDAAAGEKLDRNAIVDLVSLTPLYSRSADPAAPAGD